VFDRLGGHFLEARNGQGGTKVMFVPILLKNSLLDSFSQLIVYSFHLKPLFFKVGLPFFFLDDRLALSCTVGMISILFHRSALFLRLDGRQLFVTFLAVFVFKGRLLYLFFGLSAGRFLMDSASF
jgi:hypothetical protein